MKRLLETAATPVGGMAERDSDRRRGGLRCGFVTIVLDVDSRDESVPLRTGILPTSGIETLAAVSRQSVVHSAAMPESLPVRPARPDETAERDAYQPTLDRVPARKSVFEEAGGMPFFEGLVDRFYQGVEADPDLLALYPDQSDLIGARRRLSLFLAQYWGGPTTYNEERGHPRLYMRHMPFAIDPASRDRWLAAMRAAVAQMDPRPQVAARLLQYFEMGAEAMRNQD